MASNTRIIEESHKVKNNGKRGLHHFLRAPYVKEQKDLCIASVLISPHSLPQEKEINPTRINNKITDETMQANEAKSI